MPWNSPDACEIARHQKIEGKIIMGVMACMNKGCDIAISISRIPGGNPVALESPEEWSILHVTCSDCGFTLCDRCLSSFLIPIEELPCLHCGGTLEAMDLANHSRIVRGLVDQEFKKKKTALVGALLEAMQMAGEPLTRAEQKKLAICRKKSPVKRKQPPVPSGDGGTATGSTGDAKANPNPRQGREAPSGRRWWQFWKKDEPRSTPAGPAPTQPEQNVESSAEEGRELSSALGSQVSPFYGGTIHELTEEQVKKAAQGGLTVFQEILESGVAFDAADANGNTLLMLAAQAGQEDIVAFLLNHGADPMLRDSWGGTALTRAAESGHIHIVELLQAVGAVFEDIPRDAMTSMGFRLELCDDEFERQGLLACARVLLENGAHVEGGGEMTPLMHCARHSLYEYASLLLEFGADPHVELFGMSIADHARNRNDSRMLQILDAGSSAPPFQPNSSRDPERTLTATAGALFEALKEGDQAQVEAILDAGVSLHSTTSDGWSVLLEGVAAGPAMVQMLLDRGADPNLASEHGYTPFMRAAVTGQVEVLPILAQAGANVLAGDENGHTAARLAEHEQQDEAARVAAEIMSKAICRQGAEEARKAGFYLEPLPPIIRHLVASTRGAVGGVVRRLGLTFEDGTEAPGAQVLLELVVAIPLEHEGKKVEDWSVPFEQN
jgi:ankyrin repeat protein